MPWNEKLRQLREDRGWTQTEVAKRLGIKPNRYNQYEKGHRFPAVDILIQIADLYGVDVKGLLSASECHSTLNDDHAATLDPAVGQR